MRKGFKAAIGIVAFIALAASVAYYRPRVLCAGFLPENDMRIMVGDTKAGGISEADFNGVLDKVQEIYAPIISAHGGKLVINRKWKDGTVNASAYQSGGNFFLNMYGGLARHPTITPEGFSLVACHELGHHIGGFPKIDGEWATNEGGADYYATLKCLRRIFPAAQQSESLDPTAAKSCKNSFSDEGDRNLCGKGTMAGISVANLFQALSRTPTPPKLTTPDPKVVDKTDDNHPAGQCRLDTYFQGALCSANLSDEQSDSDPMPGACTAAGGSKIGIRPLCWYKPPEGRGFKGLQVAEAPLKLPDAKSLQQQLDAIRATLSGRGI